MNHCLKWGTHFDLANKRDRVEELEHTMEEPGFWDDPNKSAAVVQDCKKLKTTIERYEKLCNDKDDTLTLIDIAEEENDASLLPEVEESFNAFVEEYNALRIETILSGEYYKFKDKHMINAMLYLRFMQEQAEQRAATGRVCYAECTSGGLRKKVSMLR